MRFSVLVEFSFCGCAVVDGFCDAFEVSNGPSHPSAQRSSTRILALQLKISLSKISDLPFRSVLCLKLE